MSHTIRHVTLAVTRACLKIPGTSHLFKTLTRSFADIAKKDSPSNVAVRNTKSDICLRVRRARPADVPRVLAFIRTHTRNAWPTLGAPSNASQIVLSDYVSRSLAQGHSMIAEQQDTSNKSCRIRALALGTTMCKWDAGVLEKWARCVQCPRSRQLLMFTAHCLRAPGLHDKYHVHNILQVILIVPEDVSARREVIKTLARSAMLRGRDVGFSLVRFDAGNDAVIEVLEEMKLHKEWRIVYDVFGDAIKARHDCDFSSPTDHNHPSKLKMNYPQVGHGHALTVYSAFTDTPK
ncbi:PREDICTED: uncharacterized protein LOC106113409 [Papilio xuthus]|uniref:Uncharacterized protein LOC106113409 n=1 Tax=Papilio xuthus TaxID=66420 RepID=A0A194PCU2_PAPXU|nr:PREDICTED: uncharacterized protein LOC106113409 [Papilio xuthus]KPI91042.1 hypothetical protein RR46_14546 [Papilio xuthus]